jgi:hypothetical protein
LGRQALRRKSKIESPDPQVFGRFGDLIGVKTPEKPANFAKQDGMIHHGAAQPGEQFAA